MPTQSEILILGRQITDPRLYQAFKEVNDKLEMLLMAFSISPDNRIGLGFNPNPATILDLNSTLSNDPRRRVGLGLPQLTLTDILNIPNPPAGLVVYDKSRNSVLVFNGVSWGLGTGPTLSATGVVGSVGAVETDLLSVTLPPSYLDSDGTSFDWFCQAGAAGNANNKRFRVYLGASVAFDSGIQTWNGPGLTIRGTIIRTSATAQIFSGVLASNVPPSVIVYGNFGTEILANSLVLKLTGQGVVNNDCLGNVLRVNKV